MVRGNLTIKPLNAVLTRDTEFLGKMDPYCVFTVGSKTFKSPVDSDSGTNPQWGGTEFVCRFEDLDTIGVEVFDEDTVSDDKVGEGVIKKEQFQDEVTSELEVPIYWKEKQAGTIRVILNFDNDK